MTEFSSVFVYVCVYNEEIFSLCLIKHNAMKICVVGVGIGFNESDL